MDLNKHIFINDTNKKLFHSNGFAEAANGNRFGVTSRESFEQRRKIDNNRMVVGDYQRSALGSTYGALRAKSELVMRPVDIGRGASRGPIIRH
jgi:hypothetical protein